MKNRPKALTALAAGAALALTSGATFALWSAAAPIEAADVTTGSLGLRHTAPVTWTIVRADDPTGAETAVGFADGASATLDVRIRPDDVLIARTTVDTSLAGTNIVARLAAPDGVTGHDDWFRTYGHATVTLGGADGVTGMTTSGDMQVPLEVAFHFAPYDDVDCPDGVPVSVALGQLTLVLQQERTADGS